MVWRSKLSGTQFPAVVKYLLVTISVVGVHVDAVTPTAGIKLSNGGTTYAAPAWFGLQIPEEEEASYLPLRSPSGSQHGCEDVKVDDAPSGGFVLLVERGNCFFDAKALAAQEAGAQGLVVMNSVEGIYQVRSCHTNEAESFGRNPDTVSSLLP